MTVSNHVVNGIAQKAMESEVASEQSSMHFVLSFGVPAAALLMIAASNTETTLVTTLGVNFLTAEVAGGALLGLAAIAGAVSFLKDKKRDLCAMAYLLLSAVLCVWALSWLELSDVNGTIGLCALPFWFALRRDHARPAAGLLVLFAALWLAAGVVPSLGLVAALLVEWLICSAVEALMGQNA